MRRSLGTIREAADLTRTAVARQLGVAQAGLSRLERQRDRLLSTLTGYLQAAGDHPRCVVTVNGQAVELGLAALAREAPAPHFSPFPITSRRRLPPVGGRVGRRPSPKGYGVPSVDHGSWHTARVGEGQPAGWGGPSRSWSAPGPQEGQSPPFVTTTSKR